MGRDELQSLVYSSCLALDQEDFKTYLGLFDQDMRYSVGTYSPELRKEMIWLDHDRGEMGHVFKMLSQHVRMPGSLSRHASVYTITQSEKGWQIVTRVMLHYTDPDGSTRLMAVGSYEDEVLEKDGRPLLTHRHVKLDTRDLGPGIHVPI